MQKIKAQQILWLISAVFLSSACTDTIFGGKTNRSSPEPQPAPVASPAANPPETTNSVVTTPSPVPEVVDLCKEFRGKNYKILIIDLKSGWFAGDGGKFFKEFTDSACEESFRIHYIHVTKAAVETNLKDPTVSKALLPCLNGASEIKVNAQVVPNIPSNCELGNIDDYHQVWMLSGSEPGTDTADVGSNSTFFTTLVNQTRSLMQKNPSTGFFFGAGLSNIDHSNKLAASLFTGWYLFSVSEKTKPGTYPKETFPSLYQDHSPLLASESVSKGKFDKTADPFTNITSIFDWSSAAKPEASLLGPCFGDPIIAKDVKVIAKDHCDKPVIGAVKKGNHKIFVESNIARFYGTKPAEYFHRIILHLARP